MLTVPQAGILELLGELGCLRKRHIGQFAAAKYGSRPEHVARMMILSCCLAGNPILTSFVPLMWQWH